MGEGGCDGRLHVTEGGRKECDKATGVVGLTPPWGVTRRIVCPFFLCRALLVAYRCLKHSPYLHVHVSALSRV